MPRWTMTLEERFWAKVEPTGFCWNWTACVLRDGYGRFQIATRKTVLAHRVAYELLVGPIPEGLELDHLCRNRACVNPDHLEPVTHTENHRRGRGSEVARARGIARTHCKYGHEYTDENTWINLKRGGSRSCKTCAKIRNRARYIKIRDERKVTA